MARIHVGDAENASPVLGRAARVSPAGSIASSVDYEPREDPGHPAGGLVQPISLVFLDMDTEQLYLQHIGKHHNSAVAGGVICYLALSLLAYALLCADLWSVPGSEIPAFVAAGTWAAAALIMLGGVCWPGDAAPVGPIAFASGLLQISVPVVVGLACTNQPGGTCDADAARHAASAQAVLLCLACVPVAVLTVPFRWAVPPMMASSTAYGIVLGLLFNSQPALELAGRIVSTIIITGMLSIGVRRHELIDRMLFYRVIEDDGRNQAPLSTTLAKARGVRAPFRRSFTRGDLQLGADRSVHVSTDVEQALMQLRQLQASAGSRRSTTLSKRLGRTVSLLESSVLNSAAGNVAHFDWKHEIQATGVDDSVGEWLMSTLATQQVGGVVVNSPNSSMRQLYQQPISQQPTSLRRSSTDVGTPPLRRSSTDVGTSSRRGSFIKPNEPIRRSSFLGGNLRGRRSSANTEKPAETDPEADPAKQSELFASKFSRDRTRRSSDRGDGLAEVNPAGSSGRRPPSHEGDILGMQMEDQLTNMAITARPMAIEALNDFGYDLVYLNTSTDGHALYFVAMAILEKHDLIASCRIDAETLNHFLLRIERKYGNNPYHNSIHGADVMLHTYLFLNKFGFAKRLSKEQLLAALVGALIHDFNHPGTSNAHEIKLGSLLALTYSDQSVLERHHLASSFAVLKTKGFDILSGLSMEDYRAVRSMMIEVVLATDLAGVRCP